MAVPPTYSKADLRNMLRQRRRVFAEGRAFPAIAAAAAPLYALIAAASCVAGYLRVRGEPDVSALMAVATQQGVQAALPRVESDGSMNFRQWGEGDPLEQAAMIMQPQASAVLAAPNLILAPLVGFDRRGNRLGQGGGHYDRALARYPSAFVVGIAWSVQEIVEIPTELHDIRLNAVLTECEWIVI